MANDNNQTISNEDLKDYLKTSFEAGGAYSQTFLEAIKKDYPDFDPSVYNSIHNVGVKGVGTTLSYDNQKSLGENLAYISGDLVQGALVDVAVSQVYKLAFTTNPATITAFTIGFGVNESLKYLGIDLGQEAQDMYADYVAAVAQVEANFQQVRNEFPELFNSDGTLKGYTPSTTSGNSFSKYESLSNTLKNNGYDNSTLKGNLDKLNQSSKNIQNLENQLQNVKLNELPSENNKITIETNKNEVEISTKNIKTTYSDNGSITGLVSLQSGQTISHIAANTKFSTIDLLKYNDLSLEQAKNLPVGFKVLVPSEINSIDGGYGTIKEYKGIDGSIRYEVPVQDGSVKVLIVDKNGNLTRDKITFTDDNGDYQVWEKDKNGNFVQTNKIDYSEITNVSINQIGNLIIANNENFSNIEKIAISTTVSTIADFTSYVQSGKNFNLQKDSYLNLKGAVVSFAVSSYFAKNDNISDVLGMDGVKRSAKLAYKILLLYTKLKKYYISLVISFIILYTFSIDFIEVCSFLE